MIFKNHEFNETSGWDSFKEDIVSKLNANGIAQQYIYPFGGKSWIVRFIYYNPAWNLENKISFSMNAASKIKIDEKELNFKYSLQRRWTLPMNIRNSFDLYISKKGGANQKEYENVAQQIISFVMKVHKIRLSKVVLDFIQDENKVIFLVNVPSFSADRYERILEISRGIEIESKPKLTPSEIFEDKSALVYWKLWKLAFLKNEVSRIVTMKMISELRGHYNKRGIFEFDHFLKFKDTKRTWKVWELWYMIVIAEHELMKTELKFATTLGIPVNEDKNDKIKIQKSNNFKSEDFKNKLKQWRIFYYFDSFHEVDILALNKVKRPNSQLFLQIKMFEYITKFEINFEKHVLILKQASRFKANPLRQESINNRNKIRKSSYNKRTFKSLILDEINSSNKGDLTENSFSSSRNYNRKSTIKINKIRVHFFFTEIMQIADFVKNTEIEIRITDGPDWCKWITSGSTKPFEFMNPNKGDMVQTENKTLYFFSKNMDEFYLTMKWGFKFDKDIQTENLGLTLYNGVYFPDNHYYNSDVLPIEWLEIFEKKEYLLELEEKSDLTNLFDPNWNKQQLDYTHENLSFLNKTILKVEKEEKSPVKRPKSSINYIRINK